jgi:hypothetical protein
VTGLIRKFAVLPSRRKKLLLRSLAALALARIQLSIFRFRPATPRKHAPAPAAYTPQEIGWAIETASRMVPRCTCLARAVAAQAMLDASGHPSRLRIGVAPGRPAGPTLDAHAWLECDGRVLIGGHDLGRYRSLFASDSPVA